MKDGFNRTISYLRLSVTDRCNLRCLYCMPEEGIFKKQHAQMMTLEELAETAAVCAELGVKKVRITGGEPLVRKNITSLIKAISEIPDIEEVAMTTNGILLEDMASELAEAGLSRVNISLDTLDPVKFRRITRTGELDSVLRGIRAAIDAGLSPVKINTVLIRGFNDDEIRKLAELTLEEEMEVRFIELMPLGNVPVIFGADGYLSCHAVIDEIPELEKLQDAGVAKRYRIPGAKGSIGLITPVSDTFCTGCDRIRLTGDGFLKPCLHSAAEINVKGLHGEALKEKIIEAIKQKPQEHQRFTPGISTAGGRSMNRIGG